MKICNTFLKRSIGLMFSKKREAYFIFDKEIEGIIHTFFVFYPIDIYFYNKRKKLIDKRLNVKPFSIFKQSKKFKYMREKPTKR